MAKKTKELEQEPVAKKVTSKSKLNTSKTSASTSKKATTAKKSTSTSKKATTAKKSASTSKKATTPKKATKKEVTRTKKVAVKASTVVSKVENKEEKVITKKTTTKKAKVSKTATTKKIENPKIATLKKAEKSKATTRSRKTKKVEVSFKSEYYDLPYLYNKTVVKILAQTPKVLFIYWEISESDRKAFQKLYGDNFFETTHPVLIVFNDTMHYSFEVNINDFANSWYLHINDANCDYHIELGRRPYSESYKMSSNNMENIQQVYIPYYVYITSSNEMAAPNNKILFNPNQKTVKFRNVKTGQTFEKDIKQFTFITNFGIFTMQDLYMYLFPNESFEFENITLGNTSSGALSSSGMFSSQFK